MICAVGMPPRIACASSVPYHLRVGSDEGIASPPLEPLSVRGVYQFIVLPSVCCPHCVISRRRVLRGALLIYYLFFLFFAVEHRGLFGHAALYSMSRRLGYARTAQSEMLTRKRGDAASARCTCEKAYLH